MMQQQSAVYNAVVQTAQVMLQQYGNSGQIDNVGGNAVLNTFINSGWATNITNNAMQYCQMTPNGMLNIDQNYIQTQVGTVLNQLIANYRNVLMQQRNQMMQNSNVMMGGSSMGYAGGNRMQQNMYTQPNLAPNAISDLGSIYDRHMARSTVPVEQQTPPFNHGTNVNHGTEVPCNVSYINKQNMVRGGEANAMQPQPPMQVLNKDNIINQINMSTASTSTDDVVESMLTTKSVMSQVNTVAMTIVENMDDTKTGIKVEKYSTIVSDNVADIDSGIFTITLPFTNHVDPCKVIRSFTKEIPVFSQGQYYAHLVNYNTLYDINIPFNKMKEGLNKLVSYGKDKAVDMKWNTIIQLLTSDSKFKPLVDRYVKRLLHMSRCVFSYTAADGSVKAVLPDSVADIPLMLDKHGSFTMLNNTERLYLNACEHMYRLFRQMAPDKIYLSPRDPDDIKVLINRPDSGYIHSGQLLRYSENVIVETEEKVGEESHIIRTVDNGVVEMLAQKTTCMQQHTVLVTNIPFSVNTLYGISTSNFNRVTIPQPYTLLECIINQYNEPIVVNSNGFCAMAGKNVDNQLTIVPV